MHLSQPMCALGAQAENLDYFLERQLMCVGSAPRYACMAYLVGPAEMGKKDDFDRKILQLWV